MGFYDGAREHLSGPTLDPFLSSPPFRFFPLPPSFPSLLPTARGLHSSTIQLNVSAFCRIGGALMGRLGGIRGCQGMSRVYFVSETAQVELKSGRV